MIVAEFHFNFNFNHVSDFKKNDAINCVPPNKVQHIVTPSIKKNMSEVAPHLLVQQKQVALHRLIILKHSGNELSRVFTMADTLADLEAECARLANRELSVLNANLHRQYTAFRQSEMDHGMSARDFDRRVCRAVAEIESRPLTDRLFLLDIKFDDPLPSEDPESSLEECTVTAEMKVAFASAMNFLGTRYACAGC